MKLVAMGAAAIALAACTQTFSVPVTGSIGATPAQGQATASTNGAGSFSVQTLEGLSCSGTYNALDPSPTIRIPAKCTDGRTATLLATRGAGIHAMSGTVIGKLSDGTEGRFVFGDLAFNQAFPDGGGAVTR